MASERKRWFKAATSLGRRDYSNDELACLVRLMAAMKDRWASDRLSFEEASRIQLGPTEQMRISGKKRTDAAARLLLSLATLGGGSGRHRTDIEATSDGHRSDVESMSVELRGDVIAIEWPKWSEFQQSESKRRPIQAPSGDSDSDSDSEGRNRGVSEAAKGGSDAAPVSPKKPPKPEPRWAVDLAGRFRASLRKIHGEEIRLPADGSMRPWARAVRLMVERDKRTTEQIEELAKWLFGDVGPTARFWRASVLSLPKFRIQFDQMQAQRRRDAGEPGGVSSPQTQGRKDAKVDLANERQAALEQMYADGEIEEPTQEALDAARERWRNEGGRLKVVRPDEEPKAAEGGS